MSICDKLDGAACEGRDVAHRGRHREARGEDCKPHRSDRLPPPGGGPHPHDTQTGDQAGDRTSGEKESYFADPRGYSTAARIQAAHPVVNQPHSDTVLYVKLAHCVRTCTRRRTICHIRPQIHIQRDTDSHTLIDAFTMAFTQTAIDLSRTTRIERALSQSSRCLAGTDPIRPNPSSRRGARTCPGV